MFGERHRFSCGYTSLSTKQTNKFKAMHSAKLYEYHSMHPDASLKEIAESIQKKENDHILICEMIRKAATRKDIALQTKKNYLKHANIWERFGSVTTSVTQKQIDSFKEWMHNQEYTDNYISDNFKIVKASANYLSKRMDINIDTNLFKTKKMPSKLIYLSSSDVEALEQIRLNGCYENARKYFLLQVYSGQRISDLPQVLDQLDKDYAEVLHSKTQKIITVPITKRMKAFKGVKKVSDQKLNRYIKFVARKSGLNRMVESYKSYQGKYKREFVPLWTLVTTHTARRTFATLSLAKGMNPKIVKDVMGVTWNTLKIYEKESTEHTISQMNKFWG